MLTLFSAALTDGKHRFVLPMGIGSYTARPHDESREHGVLFANVEPTKS
jgi:hypothetical protein